MADNNSDTSVLAVVVAGGSASRMGGGDKCFKLLHNKPLLSYVIDTIKPSVSQLIINANGNPARFSQYPFPVVSDDMTLVPQQSGPLAGILAAMQWNQNNHQYPWLLSVASDTPFLPKNLVTKLFQCLITQADQALKVVVARSNGRTHPICALWSQSLYQDLYQALVVQQQRKIDAFTQPYPCGYVDYNHQPIDPFFNINSLEDLAMAHQYLTHQGH